MCKNRTFSRIKPYFCRKESKYAVLSHPFLLGLAILPVVLLMVFIYRQDKYQKEPVKSLAKAFIGGMMAIPLDIVIVTGIDSALGNSAIANTVFFSAFLEAGIPEELSSSSFS